MILKLSDPTLMSSSMHKYGQVLCKKTKDVA